jgi:Na+-transporting NADH:ubiquinone oxidoreductase subunit NqrB
MAGQARAALQVAFTWMKQIGTEPESSAPSLVALLALVPSAAAGILLFRLAAAEVLAIAVAAGLLAHLAARLIGQPLDGTPLLPAVVAVALIGAGAGLPWAAVVAVVAAGFELGRARFLPGARLQTGLVAYSLVLLLSRGRLADYLPPEGRATPEPIRAWLHNAPAIDPMRLYAGNVAGPILATSLLAVALGTAWLWYSRRLSLLVVITFVLGALVPIIYFRWSPGVQLDSGPLWFVAALVLADRRTLPNSAVGRPLAGFLAGLVALGARSRGFAIEAAPVAVAGIQVLTVALQGLTWVNSHRTETYLRLRDLREATMALTRAQRPPRHAQPPS